jgi:hypothetical protein
MDGVSLILCLVGRLSIHIVGLTLLPMVNLAKAAVRQVINVIWMEEIPIVAFVIFFC